MMGTFIAEGLIQEKKKTQHDPKNLALAKPKMPRELQSQVFRLPGKYQGLWTYKKQESVVTW